ncbi:hypothetical protein FNV43_RR04514 [Rhamnella rubrinervis]|uniref:Receptor-like serine/threonine-protein kinase n=1 Tax=Rhamnella rubrinervis TaxID=2594499 RepID=A0A8K0HJQ4_9ROSA|nr:hypothetical protein FNV43_RR04514 [Rhamnella rubrinervis]
MPTFVLSNYRLIFLLPLLLFSVVVAQTKGNISVGSSLTAGQDNALWLSPSEDFAFGFHQLDNDNFLLAIWYYKLTQTTTTVWYANGDKPAPRRSKLEISADRGLVLTDPQGVQELWSSGKIAASVAYAAMNDTGNCQLLDKNSKPIWQTFEHPTDTLLPSQIMEIGGSLSSRTSLLNFTHGRFIFRMLEDGTAVLNTINLPSNHNYKAYYVSDTLNSGGQVIFDTFDYLYVLRKNGEKFNITQADDAVSTTDYYQRVSLEFDGVLILSSHTKNPSDINQSWTTMRTIPDNICIEIQGELGTGPCGYNSICTLHSEERRPICNCPEGYSLLDPNDEYSGCKPNFLVGCESSQDQEDEYFMRELPNIDWPTSDYELFHPFDDDSCRNSCLHDCLCAASIFFGSSVLVNCILVWKETCGQFTYKELTEATNGFEEELGRGSCGIVYKGETESSGPIAVKMLDRVFEDSDKEFKAEMNIIGQTHHKNLARLIGYCEEKQHKLLVYEYLSNGTLARFLFGELKPSWAQRIQITFGIARGLVYLHEECSTQIIHCDIKPQNILLDEYYNARISDFGLAKLLALNQSHTKTNIRGTKGYVAPDWFRSAPVSVKVDVYSYGVLLLEIICCRRNVNLEIGGGEKGILTDWAYDCYMDRKLDVLVENDMEAMNDIKQVERFVMVAIWCLQEDPNVRPTMKKVMLMLEGIVQVSVPPTPCSFTSIN